MSDWSDEETDDPTHADRRNFYKVEQWSRDGQRVLALVSLIDSVVEQLSQVFMLRVFHVGTIC